MAKPQGSDRDATRLNPHVTPRSLSVRLLHRLADAIYHRRGWFFFPQILLLGVCIYYTATSLQFRTNRNDLVGGDKEYHRIFLDFRQEFPIEDDLVVVVESSNLERNRQFVERLGAKMQQETNLFANVFFKGDLNMLGPKALNFMSRDQLSELKQTLDEFLPMLKSFAAATNLVTLFDFVNTQIRTASREDSTENRNLVRALPALERILALAQDAIKRQGNPPSPGLYSLFEGGQDAIRNVYITFNNGRIFLLTTQALSDPMERPAVRRIRQLIQETLVEVPGLNVGLTGEPVLEVDEMDQSKSDTTLATVVSLGLVSLIFIYGYHETGRPLKATAVLIVGLGYTMGFTTLTVGHLNILTITFVPILVGLSIDFGVHLITRYEEELWHGHSQKTALDRALVNTGTGIFTGAFTTAGAFFAMGATDFDGIQEMGVICGGGMFVCLAAMMTLLPVLLLRGTQNTLDREKGPELERKATETLDRRAKLEGLWLHHPVIATTVVLLISAAALHYGRRVRFDYNLLNLQSAGLPAVIFQDKLIRTSPKSVLYAAVVAPTAVEATNLAAQLTNMPQVASVDGMAYLLTEDQTPKIDLIHQIKDLVNQVEFQPIDPNPVEVGELMQTLWSLHGYLNLAVREVGEADSELYAALSQLRATIGSLLRDLRITDKKKSAFKLAHYQQALFSDVHQTFDAIRNQESARTLEPDDLPPALRKRFIGVHGSHLLQVYPEKNVWNREAQEEFVLALRTLQPKVTGTPVQLFEYITLLKDSYVQAALYSLTAIALLVFLHFRKFSCVILALLPVAIGSLWTLGLMGLLGVSFNPANIMTLPLIIGIGVTNGIHILHRFEEEQNPSILARSTGKAVLVSGLTTIAGFGSLMLAKHRGIESLGFIMATGVGACLLVSITFLPALLNLLSSKGWGVKKTQCDNAQSTLGREEPR